MFGNKMYNSSTDYDLNNAYKLVSGGIGIEFWVGTLIENWLLSRYTEQSLTPLSPVYVDGFAKRTKPSF